MSSDETKRSEPPPASNRRSAERLEVTWSVDCETEDTFLYANITNISEMGIFVRTHEPLEPGTRLKLKFSPPDSVEAFVAVGQVQWVNPVKMLGDNLNPGMGIRFVDLTQELRERLIEIVHTIAYIRASSTN